MNSPRAFRTTELAKELVRQGHEVTLIVPYNREQELLIGEYNFKIIDMGTMNFPKIILKGKGILLLFRKAIRRILSFLLAYPDIELVLRVPRILRKIKGYDLLISIAVPHSIHWGVARIWRRNSIKNPAKIWIADCGDPFMGQENDTFKPAPYFALVEKWFMKKANWITIPIDSAIPAYYPEFHNKIRVIPQGFSFEDYPLIKKERVQNYPVFGYGGMFIPGKRDPGEFLNYLISLSQEFEFHIYTQTPKLVEEVVPDNESRIILHSPVPRNALLDDFVHMDFLVNFENVGSRQLPSKLIEYAILGKPILSIKTGELDRENVNQFLAGNYQGAYRVENIDQYRIENVAQQFIALCE